MIQDYIKALRNGKGYQWMCDYGHQLSKSELCDIIKEFQYVLYSDKNCCYDVADSLSDIYYEER